MGVPPGGHPSPPREMRPQPSRTPCRSGKKSIGAGQENKLEGQSLGCSVGSDDQALPLKRRWSLATLLFPWLGFKEMNYFSAFTLPPRRQIQPFRVGNERPVRKSARGACSQTLYGTSEVSLPSWYRVSWYRNLLIHKSEFTCLSPLHFVQKCLILEAALCPVDTSDGWIYRAAFFSVSISPLREEQTFTSLWGDKVVTCYDALSRGCRLDVT